jgi:hypothetical protein
LYILVIKKELGGMNPFINKNIAFSGGSFNLFYVRGLPVFEGA